MAQKVRKWAQWALSFLPMTSTTLTKEMKQFLGDLKLTENELQNLSLNYVREGERLHLILQNEGAYFEEARPLVRIRLQLPLLNSHGGTDS